MKYFLILTMFSFSAFAKDLVFSRDDRPVDGILTEISIKDNSIGRSVVSLKTAYYDRINGRTVEETDLIGSDMECVIKRKEKILKVTCLEDKRPADGPLLELKIEINQDRTYAAVLVETVNLMDGQTLSYSADLARGLSVVE